MNFQRLSYKKVSIKEEIPIYSDKGVLLDNIIVSTIFKEDKSYNNRYSYTTFEKLRIKISNRFKVKKTNIAIRHITYDVEGIQLIGKPVSIIIKDSDRQLRNHLINDIIK